MAMAPQAAAAPDVAEEQPAPPPPPQKLEFTACGTFLELGEEGCKVASKVGEVDPGESKLPRPFGLPKKATWLALPESPLGADGEPIAFGAAGRATAATAVWMAVW